MNSICFSLKKYNEGTLKRLIEIEKVLKHFAHSDSESLTSSANHKTLYGWAISHTPLDVSQWKELLRLPDVEIESADWMDLHNAVNFSQDTISKFKRLIINLKRKFDELKDVINRDQFENFREYASKVDKLLEYAGDERWPRRSAISPYVTADDIS